MLAVSLECICVNWRGRMEKNEKESLPHSNSPRGISEVGVCVHSDRHHHVKRQTCTRIIHNRVHIMHTLCDTYVAAAVYEEVELAGSMTSIWLETLRC